MVKALETYIVTNGNGRQAVDFYKDVFQADLVNMMTWEEMDPNCLEDRKDLIINAQLIFDGIRLQISDENPDNDRFIKILIANRAEKINGFHVLNSYLLVAILFLTEVSYFS